MAHKALYRLWRPRIFEEIIGQESIVKTLKNQIATEQIGHAYLFTGTRGTGKTSTAKVFAKAVNCENPVKSNPCNQCSTCRGITEETVMDVIEIDAASNNGVENIREIRENVKYHPSKGTYKVYIIDEVHMLSQGAFNALLKTLEEPPGHVIFILATTEPRKIPATILSRCQRYDFKPVELEKIVDRLSFILEDMKIAFDQEAIRMVSVSAEGALRDALSILEQTIDWDNRKVSKEAVMSTLGIVPDEELYTIVEGMKHHRSDELLRLVDKGSKEGKDPMTMTRDLTGYFRKLLMAKIGIELQQFSTMPREFLTKLQVQSKETSRIWIVEQMEALGQLEGRLKWSAQPRTLLELHLIGHGEDRESEDFREKESIEQLAKEVALLKKKLMKIEQTSMDRTPGDTSEVSESGSPEKTSHKPSPKTGEVRLKTVQEPDLEGEELSTMTKEDVIKLWPEVLKTLKKNKKAQLEALLKEGEILKVEPGRIVIGYDQMYSFHREALDKEEKKQQISEVIHHLSGQRMVLALIMKEEQQEKNNPANLEEELRKILPEHILEVRDD